MAFHLFHIITFLMVVVVGTNGAILPAQLYWKSMLPNTPMPKVITNLLPAGSWSEGKATWDGGNGEPCPFCLYRRYSSDLELNETNHVVFFLEHNLHYGKKLNMQLPKTTLIYNGPKFLPKEVADSIPFSSNKLENILDKFSIKKGSKEYELMKNTIHECETEDIKGEEKVCATSLESMVDFTTSKLGNNVEAITIEVEKESSESQKYVIAKGVKILGEKNKAVIVCHKENYPYAVFYCHKIDAANVYSVPLEGVDGNRVKSVAVCHLDTSKWNPKHFSFQVVKVQPGTVPICHFLIQDDLVLFSK